MSLQPKQQSPSLDKSRSTPQLSVDLSKSKLPKSPQKQPDQKGAERKKLPEKSLAEKKLDDEIKMQSIRLRSARTARDGADTNIRADREELKKLNPLDHIFGRAAGVRRELEADKKIYEQHVKRVEALEKSIRKALVN